jgi:hypothetical protein
MALSTPPRTAEAARSAIEKEWRRPLPEATWEYLVERRYVDEWIAGDLDANGVVEHLREINRAAPAVAHRDRAQLEGGRLLDGINDRMRAVAEIVARRAGYSSAVQSWRRRWIPQGVIAPESVNAWVAATYDLHRPPSWPSDPGPEQATNSAVAFFDWPHAHGRLQWFDRDANSVKVWCVPPRGPLGDLAKLAGKLSENWDWNEAFATDFVLTGLTPPRPGVRGVSFRSRRGFDDKLGPYDFMAVRASIDVEVTPEELAAWWRGVRDQVGLAGRKPIGAKAARLGVFASTRTGDTTLREDMEAWNREVEPEWRFTDWRNFRTAAYKALTALNRPAERCQI